MCVIMYVPIITHFCLNVVGILMSVAVLCYNWFRATNVMFRMTQIRTNYHDHDRRHHPRRLFHRKDVDDWCAASRNKDNLAHHDSDIAIPLGTNSFVHRSGHRIDSHNYWLVVVRREVEVRWDRPVSPRRRGVEDRWERSVSPRRRGVELYQDW